MSCDRDLSGSDLKVVQYTIVSVDPYINDARRIVYGPATIATSDDMTETDFTAWVIALYCQGHGPKGEERHHLTPEEKQYLRVCYCVDCRLTVPEADYDKQQVDALRDINRTLKEKGHGGDDKPAKTR